MRKPSAWPGCGPGGVWDFQGRQTGHSWSSQVRLMRLQVCVGGGGGGGEEQE